METDHKTYKILKNADSSYVCHTSNFPIFDTKCSNL